MPGSNHSQTLYGTAEAYLALGYSVIPVWGMSDPARPKVAGVEWGLYQRRRPTLTEIHKWFLEDGFGGLAIVTGNISRLAVLDFDTQEGFRDFSTQFPDLVATQVIQTRRGYHVYFHLPPHLHLLSRKGQGIDLLVAGRYVIARPTCIDGHAYKLIRGGQPKTLTQFDVDSINRFIDKEASLIATPTPERGFRASSFDSDGTQQNHSQPQTPTEPLYDLRGMYQHLIEKGSGRNEALFQVSLKARDSGNSINGVLGALADIHVFQLSSNSHRTETPAQRYLEAKRTVQSAFSRPPRLIRQVTVVKGDQLPNRVREKLFKCGETRSVRVIEALRLKGIVPGQVFTSSEAIELLKGIVGRDSVYAALKAQNTAGQPIFPRQNPSLLNLPSDANAATNSKTETNNCIFGRAEKPVISPKHRPANLYIMPTNDELCHCLGVKTSHSDPITLEELVTAKQTRMAAQRELIKRCPGIYPRRWLAGRLGVACDTLDTYNREIEGLHWHPCFWEQPIYWSNLNSVPDGIEINGAVLVDQTGKRYPAKRRIAAWLLGQGRRVIYKRQDANFYWYGDTLPNQVTSVEPSQIWREEARPAQPLVREYRPDKELISTLQTPALALATHTPMQVSKPVTTQKPVIPLNYRKPLPDSAQEALANRLYQGINERCADPAQHMSHFTARQLVHTYGICAVEIALTILGQRHHIDSPVGFLVTVLRSESKWHRSEL